MQKDTEILSTKSWMEQGNNGIEYRHMVPVPIRPGNILSRALYFVVVAEMMSPKVSK